MLCHFPLLVARFMLNSRYIYVYIILYMKTIRSIVNTVSHHAHSHTHTEKQLQRNGIETNKTSVELSYGGSLFFQFLKSKKWMAKKPRMHQKISVWIKKKRTRQIHTYYTLTHTTHWFSLPQNMMAQRPKTNMSTKRVHGLHSRSFNRKICS